MTAFWFAALAVLLAGPAPAALARARWAWRVPRAALVLWQSVALAAVLATLGAGLSSLTLLFTEQPGLPFLARHGFAQTTLIGLGTAFVAVVTVRFWAVAALVAVRTRRRRRHHREMVDLLHRRDAAGAVDRALLGEAGARVLRVLTGPARVAYCVPGVGGNRVVISDAVLRELSPEEVGAVLAHEQAHLRARHDLVLEAFTVLHAAFPRVVSSRAALDTVRLLVEMLADDAARRRTGALPLARALVQLASAPGQGAGGPGELRVGADAVTRVRRLAEDRCGPQERRAPHRGLAAAAYAAAAGVLGVPTLAIAVPWISSSWRALAG
ncbi:M56 family metallopeptidase [Kineococcus indalonis]|uniref:M56 family metallopeptidase n=1 Tax=Kineococcus indalonis TaxID=2696566 RepID=UPI001411C86A|nr:M56 family metallopeptidase [Kineococcus indalonis]NAZ85875.1 M48 family metalloprotease [Kineococcus indalonis]